MTHTRPLDWFILNMVPCPNCESSLTAKPVEKEWKNVFCTNCPFACRFITVNHDPNISKFNILANDLKKLLSENTLLPPLIIDYKWKSGSIQFEKVIFFPFISVIFLKEQQEIPISLIPSEQASVLYPINELPSNTLYEQPSDQEIAEIASKWDKVHSSRIQSVFRIGYARSACIKDLAINLRRQRGIVDVEEEEVDDSEDDE